MIKKGDFVDTPRFCKVEIEKVFTSRETAARQGFREPTHYQGSGYEILGKHTDSNHMIFAAVKR